MNRGLERDIERILTVSPDTRADDMMLYYHYVCERGCGEEFDLVFANPTYRASKGIPSFSVVQECGKTLKRRSLRLVPTGDAVEKKVALNKICRKIYKKTLCYSE